MSLDPSGNDPDSTDDSADASHEAVFESLLAACDEALARGEPATQNDHLVPPQLKARLHANQVCLAFLARVWPPGTTLPASPSAARDWPIPLKPTIGNFDLVHEIGRGGHGVVFLAADQRLNRLVALKVPRPEVLTTPDLHRRFLREARAASALAHPNLVPIYEAGNDGPVFFIAAGYCEGPTLASWLKQQSSLLPFEEAAALVGALADATAHAHGRGILHRDIKPANVLLAAAEEPHSPGATLLFGKPKVPCLTDFGLARLIDEDASDRTRTGTMLGTPAYMAPEQADGRTEEMGPATDVYALGAVLYEVLVGRPPFRGANDLETLRLVSAAVFAPPSALRPDLPRDLEAICLRALARRPADRYPTAAALTADLRRYLKGEPTEARPLSRLGHAARWLRRRPAWAAVAAICLAALIVIAGGGWWYSARLSTTLDETRRESQRSDNLRQAAEMRHAWQAFNNDNPVQARVMLDRMTSQFGEEDRNDFSWRLLFNLTRHEALTLTGHVGDVHYVTWSPDGGRLATAGKDYTVRIWDTTTGACLASLTGHTDEVVALAWSPIDDLLASASGDATVRFWDTRTYQARQPVLRFDRGPIASIMFSPDGTYLVSGDDSGRVIVTKTANWQTANTFETGGGRVYSIALSGNGEWMATATDGAGAQIWSFPSGRRLRDSPRVNHRARSVAFDYGVLWCGGYDLAYAWDWHSDGEPPRLLYKPRDCITSITSCGAGDLVAMAGHDEMVRIFVSDKTEPWLTLIGHTGRVRCVAKSPDGWRLATASADGTVKLWRLSRPVLAAESPASVEHAAFKSDGETLLAATYEAASGVLRQWRLRPANDGVKTIGWEIADSRPVVPVFSPTDGPTSAPEDSERISNLAASSASDLVATVRDGALGVDLWNLNTGEAVGTLLAEADSPVHSFNAIVFSPDGQTLAEAEGSSIRLWDVESQRIVRQLAAEANVSAIDFSPDAHRLAAGVNNQLELWDVRAGELLAAWDAHQGVITQLAFSPAGLLASVGNDPQICLWNGLTGKALAKFTGHTGDVNAICFSPDGRLLASGGEDQLVKLWSLQWYEEVATLKEFPGKIQGLAFSPIHPILAATGTTSKGHGHIDFWCAGGPGSTWLHSLDSRNAVPAGSKWQNQPRSASLADTMPIAFAVPVNYTVGPKPAFCAAADFNNDGNLDLAVPSVLSKVCVLIGKGDGTFHAGRNFGTGSRWGPCCVAVGDFNLDGAMDLVATNQNNTLGVLLGQGDGDFGPVVTQPTGAIPSIPLVGDFNGDATEDLAVGNMYGHSLSVFLGRGDGSFQPRVDYAVGRNPHTLATGDFNADGKLDLAVDNVTSRDVSVLLNRGDGTFDSAVNYPTKAASPYVMAAGDANGDGRCDLVVPSRDGGRINIFLGAGDGTFAFGTPVDQGAESVALADFNADGKTDLVAVTGRSIAIWAGNGNGTFQPPLRYPMAGTLHAVTLADVNGDGATDIIAPNIVGNSVTIFLNQSAASRTGTPR